MKRILTVDEQLSLSPDLAPASEAARVEEVDEALDAWLDGEAKLKQLRETQAIRHESLRALVAEHGLGPYQYVERSSGKRKLLVFATGEPKAKTKNAPKPAKPRVIDRDLKPEKSKRSDEVESRRVSRKSIEREVNTDPFGSTREQMGGV